MLATGPDLGEAAGRLMALGSFRLSTCWVPRSAPRCPPLSFAARYLSGLGEKWLGAQAPCLVLPWAGRSADSFPWQEQGREHGAAHTREQPRGAWSCLLEPSLQIPSAAPLGTQIRPGFAFSSLPPVPLPGHEACCSQTRPLLPRGPPRAAVEAGWAGRKAVPSGSEMKEECSTSSHQSLPARSPWPGLLPHPHPHGLP